MPRSDEAFTWEGDDDPTLDQGAEQVDDTAAPAVADAPADTASVGRPDDPAVPDESVAPLVDGPTEHDDASASAAPVAAPVEEEPRRMGDVALVSLGVIGGVYALWTAGWVGTVLRMQSLTGGDAMFYASAVLAILAPALWFAAVWALTRRRPVWARFAALLAGAVVLVPWPFLMLGAVGA